MPKLPKKKKLILTPLEMQFREAFKLRIFEYARGDYKRLAKILLESASFADKALLGKFLEVSGGSFLSVLRKLGVVLEIDVRRVRVTDAKGSFVFTDDYYYSGLRYLLKPVEKLLHYEFELPTAKRSYSSLGRLGFKGNTDAAASDFLAEKRAEGVYDRLPMVRLYGGEGSLRPLKLNAFRHVAKTISVSVFSQKGKRVYKVDPTAYLTKRKDQFTVGDLKNILITDVLESARSVFEKAIPERQARQVKEEIRIRMRNRLGKTKGDFINEISICALGEEGEAKTISPEKLLVLLLDLNTLQDTTMLVGFMIRHREFLRRITSLSM